MTKKDYVKVLTISIPKKTVVVFYCKANKQHYVIITYVCVYLFCLLFLFYFKELASGIHNLLLTSKISEIFSPISNASRPNISASIVQSSPKLNILISLKITVHCSSK